MTSGQDFTIAAGDDHVLTVTVKDESGAVVDLSGASDIIWALADSAVATSRVVKKLSTGGITLVSGGTTGVCSIAIAAADTAGLVSRPAAGGNKLFHELEIRMSGTGAQATVLRGTCTILPSPVKKA